MFKPNQIKYFFTISLLVVVFIFYWKLNFIIENNNSQRIHSYRKVKSLYKYLETNNSDDVESKLTLFDTKLSRNYNDNQPCVIANVEPSFHICVHWNGDKHVSATILRSGYWEIEIVMLIKRLLTEYMEDDAIFLDVGANVGIHSLFAAKLGYSVWAVEPQEKNLKQIYRSATLSNTVSRLTLVQNGVDNTRRNASIIINDYNNGASYLSNTTGDENLNVVKTVLLSDVIDEISRNSSHSHQVLIKMDIEGFECNAFLGSPQVINNQSITIVAVIMEWTSLTPHVFRDRCPYTNMVKLWNLFVVAGYIPFEISKNKEEDLQRLDTEYMAIFNGNLLWVKDNQIIDDMSFKLFL